MSIENIIKSFEDLLEGIEVKIQPSTSLNELLELEDKYSMNTDDALALYIELDEHIHHTNKYDYLKSWISEYNTFLIHKGNINDLNKYTKGGI